VADKIVQILTDSGITMLRNETQEVHGLYIIGVDDYWGTNFNPYKLLKDIDHSKANLVLCHNPDMADEPIWGDYSSWILSGHTHGGQCKPPFLDPPVLPVKNRNYTSGQFELSGGRTLYINRALGHSWQVRFNVRPEITVFTLGSEMAT
jgi:predicted MPP superfamily phosphohydrolase